MICYDSTQETLCMFLKETEHVFSDLLSSHEFNGCARVMPSIDLGFPHDVIRIAGGFATGAFVQWEAKTPIVPIDTCVNVCSASFYEISDSIQYFFNNEEFAKFNELLKQGIYVSNFHRGNHFISFLKSIRDGKYFLLLHSSASEFKSNYNGLYPSLQSRFREKIKTHYCNGRYIRYIAGDKAELFYKLASNLYEFNSNRHDFIADIIIGDRAKILNSSVFHHYGMPTQSSVVMGSHINKVGDVAPILTLPGKNIFMVKYNRCTKDELFISETSTFLTPHGWGKNHINTPKISFDIKTNKFFLDDESYDIEFGSSLRSHPNLQLREFSFNKDDENYFFKYLSKNYEYSYSSLNPLNAFLAGSIGGSSVSSSSGVGNGIAAGIGITIAGGVATSIIESSVSSYIVSNINDLRSEFNNITIFNTTQEQDKSIKNASETNGKEFGQYSLLTNNCSQYAASSLEAGGLSTTQNPIPNAAHAYADKNNKDLIKSK